MKKIILILATLLVFGGVTFIVFLAISGRSVASSEDLKSSESVAAPGTSGERKIKYYKSTMMLGEISQTPRKDSMGMDMVPVYEGESDDGATITIDPVTIQTMGVRLGEVKSGPLRRSVRTVGVVDFNETALTDITTKFKGWIEKLHVNATGRVVQEGGGGHHVLTERGAEEPSIG